MFKLRDWLIFLAGIEFFHTLVHILLPYFFQLPFKTHSLTITPMFNGLAIVINAFITLLLLWAACRIK